MHYIKHEGEAYCMQDRNYRKFLTKWYENIEKGMPSPEAYGATYMPLTRVDEVFDREEIESLFLQSGWPIPVFDNTEGE